MILKIGLNGRSLFVSIEPRWTLKPVSVTYSNSIANKLSGMSFIFCSTSIMRKYLQFCSVFFFFNDVQTEIAWQSFSINS